MAKKKERSKNPPLTNLTESKIMARIQIDDQIARGEEIRDADIGTKNELNKAQSKYSKWSSFNCELLRRLFNDSEIADYYSLTKMAVGPIDPSLSELIERFRKNMEREIGQLVPIKNSLY